MALPDGIGIAFVIVIVLILVLPGIIFGPLYALYWRKMKRNYDLGRRKLWLRRGKMTFVGCIAYGVAMGLIGYDLSILPVAVGAIVSILDFPAFSAFFALSFLFGSAALPTESLSRGLLVPSIVSWTAIGFIPYAMAKLKHPIERLAL
jgi:hypothetical protein